MSKPYTFISELPADPFMKGYPDEWFPSVSATIGDRHPERSLFQFLIAITSGISHYGKQIRKILIDTSRSTLRLTLLLVLPHRSAK